MALFLGRSWASIGLLLWSGPALAQPTEAPAPLELEWIAPDECPNGPSVQEEVARLVGATQGTPRRVEARAQIERTTTGSWRTTMTTLVDGVSGRRSFEAESCAAAVSAAALILAIAVDPLVSARSVPAPPPPPPPPQPPAPAPARVEPALPRAEIASPRLALGASLAGDVGSLPSVALGVEVVLAWTPGRFRVEVAGDAWAPQSATAPTYPGDGARFQLLTLGARVAYGWALGHFVVGPLVGAGVDDLSASGFGGVATYRRSAVWVAPGAGAFAVWSPTRWLAVRLTGQAGAPLSHPSFVVINTASQAETPIYRVPLVTGQATLGVTGCFFDGT